MHRRRSAPRRLVAGWAGVGIAAVTWALLSTASPAVAQAACTPEAEPNDQPDTAIAFSGGVCVGGSLPDGDAQDTWVWTVSDSDAAHGWTLTLDGVPGTLTSVQVIPIVSPPGVTPMVWNGQPKLLELDAGPGPEPVQAIDRLIPAGRYVLGIGRTISEDGAPLTSVDYRVTIAAGNSLPPSADHEPNDDATHASPLSGAFRVSGDGGASTDVYAWTVGPADAMHGWDLDVQGGLGSPGTLALEGPDGQTLSQDPTDGTGRAHLYDIHLAAGRYLLQVSGYGAGPHPYILSSVITDLTGVDPEPNDDPAEALPITPGAMVTGRLARAQDIDQYALTVDAGLASSLLDVRLIWRSGPTRQVCVSSVDATSAAKQLQCSYSATDASTAELPDLLLPAGRYLLTVLGTASPSDRYHLLLDQTSAPAPDFETEPNDLAWMATSFDASTTMRGRTAAGDDDFYRVRVTGPPQLWRADVTGSGLSLWLTRSDGGTLATGAPSQDGTTTTLTDLYLIPGEHWFRIQGEGEYTLHLTALGPPDPSSEREPNDDPTDAGVLGFDVPIGGRLPTRTDQDDYRFSLDSTDHIHVHVDVPSDEQPSFLILSDSAPIAGGAGSGLGSPIDYDAVLPAGDYLLVLHTLAPSQWRYAVSLTREDPFAVAGDQEPNDAAWQAQMMPPDMAVQGTASGTDPDWYAIPPLTDSHPVTVVATGSVQTVSIAAKSVTTPLVAGADGRTYMSGLLPVGVPLYVVVQPTGGYTLRVTDGEPIAHAPSTVPLPVKMTLSPPPAPPAAYWPAGQTLVATLHLADTGATPLDLSLDALTSHDAWSVTFDSTTVTLAAGASLDMPVTIHALPDLWANTTVRITVRARAADGAQTTTFVEVTPERDAAPVDLRQAWTVPDALLGGLDVASPAVGGVAVPSIDPIGEAALHDGVTPAGGGLDAPAPTLPVTLTVDLAGDQPVPVAGTILTQLAGQYALMGHVHHFDLLLSADGTTYQVALSGDLSSEPLDQAFVLPSPIQARYAQLRIDSTYGDVGRVLLGEWKVVAAPGTAPDPAPLDIAAPIRGGHVVWMDPQPQDPVWMQSLVDPDQPPQVMGGVDADGHQTWAVGFNDDRAAQVTELRWADPPAANPNLLIRSVAVAISLDSPMGPWRSVGTWKLKRAADGSVAPYRLATGTWARFIRFTASARKGTTRLDEPGVLSVIEANSDASYRSVVGEWGQASSDGPYEAAFPPDLSVPADAADDNDTPETADPLSPLQPVAGRVQAEKDVDWFVFNVPAGQNSVALTLGGVPNVGATLTLQDAAGTSVPLSPAKGAPPGSLAYEASVTPGTTYHVKVEQQPFSAVVTFDTSGSVGPFATYVEASMRSYTAGIVHGNESVQILPFGERPLLDTWTNDQYVLQDAMDGWVWVNGAGSSEAEGSLIGASKLLDGRQGARAILMVTDAETNSFERTAELWRTLPMIRPTIFTVSIGGIADPVNDRRHMQDWAAAGHGAYEYAATLRDVDRAFDRMATWLRRPAAYTLALQTSAKQLPPPKPGTISVVSVPTSDGTADGRPRTGAGVAVELVLDTSGSMLDRFGGRRRIDVAKSVLDKLVTQDLPAGAPVALRVFRQKARSCETQLAVPLGPLDPDAMTATIDRLTVQRSVNTPLAAAIHQVSSDLAGATGPRIVVVVSDGLENCGGDPAKAVRQLRAKGIDITLNVVGLSLNDRKIRRSISRLAKLGGGTYFDARDQSSLEAGIRAAVSPPFEIYDAAGALVGSGTVDGVAVSLPPGTYRVVVLSEPQQTFDGVVVSEGGSTSLSLGTEAS